MAVGPSSVTLQSTMLAGKLKSPVKTMSSLIGLAALSVRYVSIRFMASLNLSMLKFERGGRYSTMVASESSANSTMSSSQFPLEKDI